MPKPFHNRLRLMKLLGFEYDMLMCRHYNSAPRNGIPVGGGDWMDLFFRMEALRGCLTALRLDKSLCDAVVDGKAVSSIAVKIWNSHREWQVHRWEKTCHQYLEVTVVRLKELSRYPQRFAREEIKCQKQLHRD